MNLNGILNCWRLGLCSGERGNMAMRGWWYRIDGEGQFSDLSTVGAENQSENRRVTIFFETRVGVNACLVWVRVSLHRPCHSRVP